ncbi:MAG: apolipoprotein N-acyltransferase [Proteobacteria bacterium]|nr:apolipoprotein N-acyltransferase [Pseudomonadota bacterium]
MGTRPRLALLLAFLSGATLVAAFEPVGLYPLALVCPALLIHLWLCAPRARDAAWIGFGFGMGLFTAGVSWVYVSLSVFGGMPAPIAAFATLAYCAFLSWPLAAAGYAQHRLPAGESMRALCVIPALWMVAELLRGWGLTGFPWLMLGYATTDTPLAGYAPVTGVYGVSLLVAACAGLALRALSGPARVLPLALLAALIGAGALLRTVEWTQPHGLPVSASLLQGNVAQELKFDPERFDRTFATYERLASGSKARLIVLPETALPRFIDRIDPVYLARLESIARSNGGDLLLGVPYRTGPEKYFNSVVSLGTSPPQIYSKSHLVPFGEFVLPGFGWVVGILQVPMSEFSRGAAVQQPLAVAGQRVAVNICYEDAFGEELIGPLPGATLLVNVSNMAWFGDTLAPGQHLQMARMRTIETGRAMLAATNTGMTAAIDRGGRVLGQLPQYAEGRLDVDVSGYTGATPYVRFGNSLALIAAALLIALSAALRKR